MLYYLCEIIEIDTGNSIIFFANSCLTVNFFIRFSNIRKNVSSRQTQFLILIENE